MVQLGLTAVFLVILLSASASANDDSFIEFRGQKFPTNYVEPPLPELEEPHVNVAQFQEIADHMHQAIDKETEDTQEVEKKILSSFDDIPTLAEKAFEEQSAQTEREEQDEVEFQAPSKNGIRKLRIQPHDQ